MSSATATAPTVATNGTTGSSTSASPAGTPRSRHRMSSELAAVATARHLPVQQAVFQAYGSDAAQLIRRGVESALVAYPTPYTHSPIETVDERDIEACVELLVAFATTPAP